MQDKPKSDAFALADAHFAVCQTIEEFLGRTVRPIVSRTRNPGAEHDTYDGALIRVHAWLRSLGKLDHPGDFQGVMTASRAIFEIAVDLTLLKCDAACSYSKLSAWEDSAKLHAAERLQAHYANRGAPVPSEHQALLDFIRNESQRVRNLRQRNWGSVSHPSRWTGRSLERDAAAADAFGTDAFAEYYAVRYPQVCWNTHGSGLAGVRNIGEEHFPALSAFAFGEAATFSVVAAKRALELLDQYDSVTAARFAALAKQVAEVRIDVWRSHKLAERSQLR